jgi:glycosyltransferase involved in cell wall biosynthesis
MTGSFAVARMIQKHRKQGTWGKKINRIVSLTDFAKSKFVEAGIPAEKILVKPNFVHDHLSIGDEVAPEKKGAIFVGRLSKEKGLATLVRAWQGLDVPLTVAGDGPLASTLNSLSENTVKVLGRLDRMAVLRALRGADFLVMPSECYEGFPLVLAEAFMMGLPVVTSRLGSMAEIVEDGITGVHFEAGNSEDLADKVRWMYEHPEECRRMGLNARQEYEKKYTPTRNYEQLMHIYQQAIEDSASNGATWYPGQ